MDVLVVDPGELGELLATLLQQYGLRAGRATSGEQALTLALDHRPSVVVVEADLPDTSGLDLAELFRGELRARVVLTHAPGLPLSDAAVARRIRTLDAAFPRPFRSLALIEAVARLAGKSLARAGATTTSTTLTSTEGMPIEELADIIDVPIDEEAEARSPPALAEDEVSFTDVDDRESDEILLEDVDAEPTLTDKKPRPASAEAARPLAEVLDEEQRQRSSGAFSPGELAELWARVQARRATAPDTSSSRPSEGALTPRVLADLLDAFHQSQTTGELWLENGAGARRVLLLRRGALAGARSNVVGENLLAVLQRRGALDAGAAAHVTSLLKSRAFKTVADAVLALDLTDESALQAAIEDHVRRVAIGAFSWPTGHYRFTLDGRAAREPVAAQVFVGDVIVHAMVLLESDASLERAAPDDARFAPATDTAYGLEHLHLSPQEARVVVAMDGTKTIADLITLFHPLPARVVRGLAAGLFCLHLTRFVGRGAASARRISFF